jgi:hypothetical protein
VRHKQLPLVVGANTGPASLAAPAIIPPALRPRRSTRTASRAPHAAQLFLPADDTFLWYNATAKGPDKEHT